MTGHIVTIAPRVHVFVHDGDDDTATIAPYVAAYGTTPAVMAPTAAAVHVATHRSPRGALRAFLRSIHDTRVAS